MSTARLTGVSSSRFWSRSKTRSPTIPAWERSAYRGLLANLAASALNEGTATTFPLFNERIAGASSFSPPVRRTRSSSRAENVVNARFRSGPGRGVFCRVVRSTRKPLRPSTTNKFLPSEEKYRGRNFRPRLTSKSHLLDKRKPKGLEKAVSAPKGTKTTGKRAVGLSMDSEKACWLDESG